MPAALAPSWGKWLGSLVILAVLAGLLANSPAWAAIDPLASPESTFPDLLWQRANPLPAVRMSEAGGAASSLAWLQGTRLLQASDPKIAALICQGAAPCHRPKAQGGILSEALFKLRHLVGELGWEAAMYSYHIYHTESDPIGAAGARSAEFEKYLARDRVPFSVDPDKFSQWLMVQAFNVDGKYRLWRSAYYNYYRQHNWRTAFAAMLERHYDIGSLVTSMREYFGRFWLQEDFSYADVNEVAREASALDKAAISYLGLGRKWLGDISQDERDRIMISFLRDRVWPYLQARNAEGITIWHQTNRDAAQRYRQQANDVYNRLRQALGRRYTLEVQLEGPVNERAGLPVRLGPWAVTSGQTGIARFKFTLMAYLLAGGPKTLQVGGGVSGMEPVSAQAPKFQAGQTQALARVFTTNTQAVLLVRVWDALSGKPLARAQVAVYPGSEAATRVAHTDLEGARKFYSGQQGNYMGLPLDKPIKVMAKYGQHDPEEGYATLIPGQVVTLNLKLMPWTGQALVQVRDAQSLAPLPGAHVELKGGGGSYQTVSDAGGWARFAQALLGDYQATASKEGYSSASLELKVDRQTPSRRRLALKPLAPSVRLTIKGPSQLLLGQRGKMTAEVSGEEQLGLEAKLQVAWLSPVTGKEAATGPYIYIVRKPPRKPGKSVLKAVLYQIDNAGRTKLAEAAHALEFVAPAILRFTAVDQDSSQTLNNVQWSISGPLNLSRGPASVFELEPIPAGRYAMVVSAAGYRTLKVPIDVQAGRRYDKVALLQKIDREEKQPLAAQAKPAEAAAPAAGKEQSEYQKICSCYENLYLKQWEKRAPADRALAVSAMVWNPDKKTCVGVYRLPPPYKTINKDGTVGPRQWVTELPLSKAQRACERAERK